MKFKLLCCAMFAASIGLIAPVAAKSGSGFKMMEEKTIALKSGKTVKVMVGTMHGKTMVMIPMDDLNEILMRSEGHDMSTP